MSAEQPRCRRSDPLGPSFNVLAAGEWRSHAVPTVSSYGPRETRTENEQEALWLRGRIRIHSPGIVRSPERSCSPSLGFLRFFAVVETGSRDSRPNGKNRRIVRGTRQREKKNRTIDVASSWTFPGILRPTIATDRARKILPGRKRGRSSVERRDYDTRRRASRATACRSNVPSALFENAPLRSRFGKEQLDRSKIQTERNRTESKIVPTREQRSNLLPPFSNARKKRFVLASHGFARSNRPDRWAGN